MQCGKLQSLILASFFSFAAISTASAQEVFADGMPTVNPNIRSEPSKKTSADQYSPWLQEFAPVSQATSQADNNEKQATESATVQELIRPAPIPVAIDLTAPTEDLWLRLRNGFSMPGLNNELVLQQQQWYLSHPEYLRRVVERSRPYIHHIVEELEKRGMPTELALLPIVESAFNPGAYSHAKAAGLWQFIPSTGKRFDLKQNWWHDQRRDIVASTEAALEYLQTIYEMHGDWHLALASYNWGEGAVKKAIQKNLVKGLPTDYSSLTMPEETRQYVPKLIALKNIFSSPETLAELRIPVIPNRPFFATIETSKPIDVRLAARLAGMSVDEFIKLNPAHNRPVISSASKLIIPADKAQAFRNNLNNHDAPLSSWQLYTTKSAERLDKLAPRFGISLASLKQVNGIKGGLRIAPGTSLLVPANGGEGLRVTPEEIRAPQVLAEESGRRHGRNGKKISKSGKGRQMAHAGKNNKPVSAGKNAKRSASKTAVRNAPAKKSASAAKTNVRRRR